MKSFCISDRFSCVSLQLLNSNRLLKIKLCYIKMQSGKNCYTLKMHSKSAMGGIQQCNTWLNRSLMTSLLQLPQSFKERIVLTISGCCKNQMLWEFCDFVLFDTLTTTYNQMLPLEHIIRHLSHPQTPASQLTNNTHSRLPGCAQHKTRPCLHNLNTFK